MQDALTQQIWDGLISTERAMRYSHILANKSLRWHRWLSGALVAAACGVATPFLLPFPEYVGGAFFACVALISIWYLVTDYPTQAVTCRMLSDQYTELKAEWKRLWYVGASQDDVDRLREKLNRIGRNVNFPDDDGAEKKATDDAYDVLRQELEGTSH